MKQRHATEMEARDLKIEMLSTMKSLPRIISTGTSFVWIDPKTATLENGKFYAKLAAKPDIEISWEAK